MLGLTQKDSSAVAISSAAMSKLKGTICQMNNILKSSNGRNFNRQPWELVEQIWKETSANRILVIHQKDESTISSTLFDWPILQHANGYILKNIDFTTVRHFCKILSQVEYEQRRRRCCTFVFTTIAAKTKKIALPLKKDTFWKPSKRDMQEAFVIQVQLKNAIKLFTLLMPDIHLSVKMWFFIQKYFFEIETEWDKTVSGVCELISDIISYNIDEISD
ncbi:hypothetical protein Avbf_15835 [Armadillidium vulgare]|nr:hypothetical protein Avbf_15835 [Armadillidium vulgare]